jgi:hypothetical protein
MSQDGIGKNQALSLNISGLWPFLEIYV